MYEHASLERLKGVFAARVEGHLWSSSAVALGLSRKGVSGASRLHWVWHLHRDVKLPHPVEENSRHCRTCSSAVAARWPQPVMKGLKGAGFD